MRLHLDTTGASGSTGGIGASAPLAAQGKSSSGVGDGSQSPDRVAVSDASRAWAASFNDRLARVQQLTSAVQSGSYRVPSQAISQSIVASAIA